MLPTMHAGRIRAPGRHAGRVDRAALGAGGAAQPAGLPSTAARPAVVRRLIMRRLISAAASRRGGSALLLCGITGIVDQSGAARPFRSQTTCPARMVTSHSSFWRALHAAAGRIDEAEVALAHGQHRDVGLGADAEVAEVVALDDRRRLDGVGGDDVLQRHAEVHDLRHHVEDVLHAGVLAAGVQVGADDVREEALLGGRHRLPPQEAAAAVADVEEHAALAGGDDVGLDLALLVDDRIAPAHVAVHVRQDVARPQVLVEEIVERQRREVAAEVDHHRHLGVGAGLDRAIDRVPVAAVVVRHLDADDHARVLADAHRRQLGVHVVRILLGRPALHPRADDVEERQDPRLRGVDDVGLELAEVAPAGAAGVDQRRLAAAERMAVGQDGRSARCSGRRRARCRGRRGRAGRSAPARRRGRRRRRRGSPWRHRSTAATSAILPSAMATSITPSRPFFGSMTWPPLIRMA